MKTFTISGPDTVQVSDGFHTMDELYEHRVILYIVLCRILDGTDLPHTVWKSREHSDGTKFPGWFVLGIDIKRGKQITYHVPDSKWDLCDFAEEFPKAPPFDGHTSDNALARLLELG
jgi:hypothetical protein